MYNITCVLTQAGIAQLVVHFTRNEGVVGSSPISSFYSPVGQRSEKRTF